MPENEPQIVIPEGAPLMPEFFPDLVNGAPATPETKPVPNWMTIALFVGGVFVVGKVFKMF